MAVAITALPDAEAGNANGLLARLEEVTTQSSSVPYPQRLRSRPPHSHPTCRLCERERIADQLRRAMEGDAWHSPALRELKECRLKWLPQSRSSARTSSVRSYVISPPKAVRRRLQGDLARLTPEEDLAGGGRTNCGGSERGVGPPGAEPILQSMSSVYVTLHGLVQHHLYHAGQIALLKKAVGPR
jgi:hypothetical protein